MKGLAPHTRQIFEAVSKLDCIKPYLYLRICPQISLSWLADISVLARRYLRPWAFMPQLYFAWPADISARELSCPNYTLRGIIGGKIKKCTPIVSSHSSSRQMALCFVRMDFLYYRCLFETAKFDGLQPPKKHWTISRITLRNFPGNTSQFRQ